MNDPVIERILSQKDYVDAVLLEALEDGQLREALRDPTWRDMFLRSYRMKDKDIPSLIKAVEKMSERQWDALLNMMEVLSQSG